MRIERDDVKSRFSLVKDAEIATKFEELVGEEFKRCKETGLAYLQADIAARSTAYQCEGTISNTKKEAVRLPKFRGDEETAYFKYPV